MDEQISTFLAVLQGRSAPRYSNRYHTKEGMYEYLKEITDEDFGYDVQQWQDYFEQYDMETPEGLKLAFKGWLRRTLAKKKNCGKLAIILTTIVNNFINIFIFVMKLY